MYPPSMNQRLTVSQVTEHNENNVLECPWAGEPTEHSKTEAHTKVLCSPDGLLY